MISHGVEMEDLSIIYPTVHKSTEMYIDRLMGNCDITTTEE